MLFLIDEKGIDFFCQIPTINYLNISYISYMDIIFYPKKVLEK